MGCSGSKDNAKKPGIKKQPTLLNGTGVYGNPINAASYTPNIQTRPSNSPAAYTINNAGGNDIYKKATGPMVGANYEVNSGPPASMSAPLNVQNNLPLPTPSSKSFVIHVTIHLHCDYL